jgi:hypothetical protein
MPLGSTEHGHARIEAFLWGLLPDNDRVLENWGRRFQVSPRNVFRLITHVGEDCAGAVQFVRAERLEELQKDNLNSCDSVERIGHHAEIIRRACPLNKRAPRLSPPAMAQ